MEAIAAPIAALISKIPFTSHRRWRNVLNNENSHANDYPL
jgi:hypothetical protein